MILNDTKSRFFRLTWKTNLLLTVSYAFDRIGFLARIHYSGRSDIIRIPVSFPVEIILSMEIERKKTSITYFLFLHCTYALSVDWRECRNKEKVHRFDEDIWIFPWHDAAGMFQNLQCILWCSTNRRNARRYGDNCEKWKE